MIQDRAELTRCQDSVPSVCLQSSSPQYPISEKRKLVDLCGRGGTETCIDLSVDVVVIE